MAIVLTFIQKYMYTQIYTALHCYVWKSKDTICRQRNGLGNSRCEHHSGTIPELMQRTMHLYKLKLSINNNNNNNKTLNKLRCATIIVQSLRITPGEKVNKLICT